MVSSAVGLRGIEAHIIRGHSIIEADDREQCVARRAHILSKILRGKCQIRAVIVVQYWAQLGLDEFPATENQYERNYVSYYV